MRVRNGCDRLLIWDLPSRILTTAGMSVKTCMTDCWWSSALSESATLKTTQLFVAATSFFGVREFHGVDAISVRNAALEIQRATFKNVFDPSFITFIAKIIISIIYSFLLKTKLFIAFDEILNNSIYKINKNNIIIFKYK